MTVTSNGSPYATRPLSCLYQDGTWYGGRPRPRRHVLDRDPVSPMERGTAAPHFSVHVYCGQTVANLSNAELLLRQGLPQKNRPPQKWDVGLRKFSAAMTRLSNCTVLDTLTAMLPVDAAAAAPCFCWSSFCLSRRISSRRSAMILEYCAMCSVMSSTF